MTEFRVSRRAALGTGIGVLVATASLPAAASARTWAGVSAANRSIIQQYYGAWGKKEHWEVLDRLLADDFTFTSAAPDDHISKTKFRTQCWNTQSPLIAGFDLERVFGAGDEAFVKYLCRTKSGKSFRNVEYLRLKDGKVEAIECYFGGAGYPSVANGKHA